MKKYIPLKETASANNLKVEVYYDKGGFSYVTYKNQPRGFYISVTPVFRENRGTFTMEQFGAFSGYKRLVLEVNRFSDKQYNKAVELSKEYEQMMVDRLVAENGFILAD